jgi:hypothetical protein
MRRPESALVIAIDVCNHQGKQMPRNRYTDISVSNR